MWPLVTGKPASRSHSPLSISARYRMVFQRRLSFHSPKLYSSPPPSWLTLGSVFRVEAGITPWFGPDTWGPPGPSAFHLRISVGFYIFLSPVVSAQHQCLISSSRPQTQALPLPTWTAPKLTPARFQSPPSHLSSRVVLSKTLATRGYLIWII
jgi:hypothetical protein